MSNEVRIVVQSTRLNRVEPWKGKNYGEQDCAIYNGGDFPMPIKVRAEQGHEYPPGDYTIDPRSYTRDDMGNLKIKGLKLLPLGGSSSAVKK